MTLHGFCCRNRKVRLCHGKFPWRSFKNTFKFIDNSSISSRSHIAQYISHSHRWPSWRQKLVSHWLRRTLTVSEISRKAWENPSNIFDALMALIFDTVFFKLDQRRTRCCMPHTSNDGRKTFPPCVHSHKFHIQSSIPSNRIIESTCQSQVPAFYCPSIAVASACASSAICWSCQ